MPASNAAVVSLLRAQAARFWDRVDRSDGPDACWPWLLTHTDNGYGRVTFSTQGFAAAFPTHRVAYMLEKGPIPAGLDIDHLCRNRSCSNPAHLEAVTRTENQRRAAAARPTGSIEKRAGKTGERWRVRYRKDGKNMAVTFTTQAEAVEFLDALNAARAA